MGLGHHHHHHSGDHDHHDGHSHGHSGDIPQALGRAIMMTVAFMVVEIVGGYYANSLALMSDGAHMLTDAGAMVFSLFVYWISRRPATPEMSFGYHRAEILGALASGLVIWLVAGFLIFEAISRLGSPPEVRGPVVFVIAGVGLVVNLVSMKFLHSAQQSNLNVRAAYLHMFTDLLGSVGALISGAVIWLTGWTLIDPIVTLLFSVIMLFSSWKLVKDSVGILMESTPSHVDPAQVGQELKGLRGVQDMHDLHVWSVSSGRLALSVHLISAESEMVLNEANEVLERKFGIIHTTIQVEHPEKFSSTRCYDCKGKTS